MDNEGIALADAIEMLRAELIEAQRRGAGEPIVFPVQSLTVELQIVATRSLDGKAGFKVPIIELEIGGGRERALERTQKITVVFGEPVTPSGEPARIASYSDESKG